MAINFQEALRLVTDAWNNVTIQTIQNCWEYIGIISKASSAEITLAACGTETEVVEEIHRDIQGFHTIFSKHLMSANNWLDVDNRICTGEVLSNDAIVEIFNPSNQCNGDFKSDNDETENPLCAVTINKVKSVISTLIDYLEQHSSLPKATNYLDNVWAIKRDIESFSKESLVQHKITHFFR